MNQHAQLRQDIPVVTTSIPRDTYKISRGENGSAAFHLDGTDWKTSPHEFKDGDQLLLIIPRKPRNEHDLERQQKVTFRRLPFDAGIRFLITPTRLLEPRLLAGRGVLVQYC